MKLGSSDAKDEGDRPQEDPSIVPGLADPVPAPRGDLGPGLRRVSRLDPSQDPDRYDASMPTGPMDLSKDPDRFENGYLDPVEQPVVVGPLDLSKDPDRMPKPGSGQSLTDLIGKERSYEEDRDGYEWIVGLLAVLAFLALVAFFFNSVLSP
jgi:hypothetical protein